MCRETHIDDLGLGFKRIAESGKQGLPSAKVVTVKYTHVDNLCVRCDFGNDTGNGSAVISRLHSGT